MAKLVILLADGSTMDFLLRRERVVIGRRADNDICLPNIAVSGEHSAVVTILEDSFLEDLGSTNGTLVNGKAINKHLLRDRDQIDIGRHKLVFCVDESAVLSRDTVKAAALRAAAGDLGELVELAKPIVRQRRAVAPRPRPDPEATGARGNPWPELTQKISAFVDQPAASSASRDESAAVAALRILSGPSGGRTVNLTQDETTMGRAGVQVASIVRVGGGFQLKAVEGARPMINGQVLADQVAPLAGNDVIEVAGTRLEFVLPPAVAGEIAASKQLDSAA